MVLRKLIGSKSGLMSTLGVAGDGRACARATWAEIKLEGSIRMGGPWQNMVGEWLILAAARRGNRRHDHPLQHILGQRSRVMGADHALAIDHKGLGNSSHAPIN